MRRLWSILLPMLILVGCGRTETVSQAVRFRAELVQAGGCGFRCAVTAGFSDHVTQFRLDCGVKEDSVELTVLEPQTIAGITATVTDSGGQITYDGMALDFGLLANGNVIPMAAPGVVAACWQREYIAGSGEENGCERVRYVKDYDEKELLVDTWFENGIPISAEVCYNGQRILQLTISDFTMN